MEKLGLETLISPSDNEEADVNSSRSDVHKVVSSRRGNRVGRNGCNGGSGNSATDGKSKSSSKTRSARAVRPDLGTVLGSVPSSPATKENAPIQTSSTLGTLSSLLFGRKGGLL